MMSTVLVTGSTGYVGSKLSLALAQKGYSVRALFRNVKKTPPLMHPNIRLFKGSILDRITLDEAMIGCEGVFHTAAFVRLWSNDKSIYYKTNVEGTKNVLNAAKNGGVKRVICTGTAGVFGPSNGIPVTEDRENHFSFISEYEASKAKADQIILNSNSPYLETIIVYPTRIFGPGLRGASNSIVNMIQNYINGKWHFIPGNGEALGNYVFIDDVINGHMLAYENGKAGNRYLLSGETLSYNYFFNCINEIINHKHFLIKMPAVVMRFIANLMLLRTKITGLPPISNQSFFSKSITRLGCGLQQS